MHLLLVLLATVAGAARPAEHDLSAYLALAARYGAGQRPEALRELRGWGLLEVEAAVREIAREEDRLRGVAASAHEIDFGTVERAVLLEAEAGLVGLTLVDVSRAETAGHLQVSTTLYEWSRKAAERLRQRAADAERDRGRLGRGHPAPHTLRVRERIAPRDYYAAIAAATLAFGFPLTARSYALETIRAAPLDGEAHLLAGCVAASLAEVYAVRHQDGDAERSRRDAEKGFRDALAIDPGAFEARLRLGKLLLDERRAIEADALLSQVEQGAADARRRYLAQLFRARAAERGDDAEAAAGYRRALETWPDSQAARLGLARLLERSAGPSAAAEEVAATLAASRRPDRAADPWWSYLLGPPGLAPALLDRVWDPVVGR